LEEEADFATDALYSREVNVRERKRNNTLGKERSRKQLKTFLIGSHVSHAHVAVAITICMIVWSSEKKPVDQRRRFLFENRLLHAIKRTTNIQKRPKKTNKMLIFQRFSPIWTTWLFQEGEIQQKPE